MGKWQVLWILGFVFSHFGKSADQDRHTKAHSGVPMTDDELILSLRNRIDDPHKRIDMNTLPPPKLYPTVSRDEITTAEAKLGMALPPFLARVYTEVANGGFGPAGGLVGIHGGYADAEGRTLEETYASFVHTGWPPNLLPLWDWGDAAWSCIDARSLNGTVVTHDESGPTTTKFVVQTWLEDWVAGVDLFSEIFELEDITLLNPFTRKPMPAKRRGRAKGS
jgi:hypothetical protein